MYFQIISVTLISTVVIRSTAQILKHPELLESETSNIFLTMAARPDSVFDSIETQSFPDRFTKTEQMTKDLKSLQEMTQAPILSFLKQTDIQNFNFKSYWISNQIYIKNATPPLIRALLVEFHSNLVEISREIVLPRMPVVVESDSSARPLGTIPWGIQQMNAEGAWTQGATGRGINVAVIDTGIRSTHQDLITCPLLWHDGKDTNVPIPVDADGHGTHCCGTIAGRNGIGMAPDSSLSVCSACANLCTQAALMNCGQWTLCPADNCAVTPHIVSNSWGGSGGQSWFDPCIRAWLAADIWPIFAGGNSGSACSTLGSPADHPNVLAVAAHDMNRKCATFSSRGPSLRGGAVKPECTAPGVKVLSCSHVADDQYRELSGTSMACPHIAGYAALYRSKNPSATFSDFKNTIKSKSDRNMTATNEKCGSIDNDVVWPNYVYGWGSSNCGTGVTAEVLVKQEIVAAKQEEVIDQ